MDIARRIRWVKRTIEEKSKPIETHIENHSPSLAQSFSTAISIFAIIILISPILVSSLVVSYLLMSPDITFTAAVSKEMLVFILASLSIITPLIIQHNNNSLYQSMYAFALFATGAYIVHITTPPELYVVFFAIVYGIGGYISHQISPDIQLGQNHILSQKSPHKSVLIVSVIALLALTVLPMMTYTLVSSSSMTTVFVVLLLISYVSMIYISDNIKYLYKHSGINTRDSSLWLLTPKLALIVSVISVFNGVYSELALLVAIPPVIGILFYVKIKSKIDDVFGQKVIADNPIRTDNTNIDVSDEIITFSVEKPDKSQTEEWIQILQFCEMAGVYVQDKEQLENVKSTAIENIVENINSYKELINIPDAPRREIIQHLSETDQIELDTIHDIDIRREISQYDDYIDYAN